MEDRTIVAHGCRKTKNMICGIEGKNVVAYGCLPSPAPATRAEYRFQNNQAEKFRNLARNKEEKSHQYKHCYYLLSIDQNSEIMLYCLLICNY